MFSACTAGSDPGGSDTDPANDPDPSDTGETTTAGGDPAIDEQLVRALIAGDLTVDEVLPSVAWTRGWPVRTAADTFLFVRRSQGQEWAFAGDSNGWSPEPMTAGDGFYWIELPIAAPEGQAYKFVSGGEYSADPFARGYRYDDFGEFSFVRPPTATWHLERWPDLAV
jgi:hypothetical protein